MGAALNTHTRFSLLVMLTFLLLVKDTLIHLENYRYMRQKTLMARFVACGSELASFDYLTESSSLRRSVCGNVVLGLSSNYRRESKDHHLCRFLGTLGMGYRDDDIG